LLAGLKRYKLEGVMDIIGHTKNLKYLLKHAKQNTLSHAYLFVGPENVGKLTVAESIARVLHCKTRSLDLCGECTACEAITHRTHSDFIWIGKASDGEDEKRELKIEEVRNAIKKLSLKSSKNEVKTILIEDADRLTTEAVNALLKNLE